MINLNVIMYGFCHIQQGTLISNTGATLQTVTRLSFATVSGQTQSLRKTCSSKQSLIGFQYTLVWSPQQWPQFVRHISLGRSENVQSYIYHLF